MRRAAVGRRLFSSLADFVPQSQPNRILVIGSLGQIGQELVPELRRVYGKDKVIGCDVRRSPETPGLRYVDLSTPAQLSRLVVEEGVDWIVHNASILSAVGEKNPELAMKVNIEALNTVFSVARAQSTEKSKIRLFVPSSISAFGPSTPMDGTPNETIQQPTTIYGVSKVYAELMGSYFHKANAFNFRSLRYPGILSASEPGGGTTDWAVHIFKQAILYGKYVGCFLSADSALPMMYMPDCLRATMSVIDAPNDDRWRSRVYNVTSMSLAPKHLEIAIRKFIPEFEIQYAPPGDFRQGIANSWPRSIDDSLAREDWGWKAEYGVEAMTRDMLLLWKKRMQQAGKDTVALKNI